MTGFLLLAFTFLIAGVIAVPIASRLGLGSVLGYLIAGIALGPLIGALGVDLVSIQHFAEFGVVMMLFLVGLELEPKLLWEMRARLLGLGGLQVLGTVAGVTGIAMAFGQPWQTALTIGMVLSLSSTAIVLQTLNEKGLARSDGGRASFSVLLFQDIAVIPMLAIIPLLALPDLFAGGHAAEAAAVHGESAGFDLNLVDGLGGWQRALVTLAAIGAVIGIGAYLTRPIFRYIARAKMRELFTAAALMIVIGIALLMTLVGLSPALGTFLAGVVLANSEYRHELESDIDPFRGLLLGLFFMTVGAGINFALLAANPAAILGAVAGLIALKAGVLWVLARIFKLQGADRWLFALGLAQAGEFAFVLLAFTTANGVIPDALAAPISLIVALSMLLTPALFILLDKVVMPHYLARSTRPDDPIEPDGKIIIAGHGRFGGIINRMLSSAGHATTVIDYSSEHLEALRTFGFQVHFGDATRPDLLQAAGIAEAKLLVIAIDDKAKITELVRYALHTYPDLHVLARAIDRDHVYELWAAGCRDIVRETYDSSIRAGRSALQALGLNPRQAARISDEFERLDRASMPVLAGLYRLDTPPHLNAPYVAKVKEISEEWDRQLRGQMAEAEAEDAEDTERTAGEDVISG
ncbi:cation:proton antiporter domain-containing protein [Maricaulis salignorans]|uniref:Kef-type potassium/proton antiporter, CPA2 family n=1 Tax=Maricaulis salignorans TaxID=144026 RepID=A0A1G9X1T4_9PROT|nr:cation:proton antiporter [Maricaulis salignorans]SDM90647.1 Kef-type potassium/proton antiporter, CPA2 family [Maricaulis salignorans]